MSAHIGGGLTTIPGIVVPVKKTITFAGAAGSGAVGTVTVFTITGKVLLKSITTVCKTTLTTTGAATMTLGVVGQAAIFIAATVATTITANLIWMTTTATAGGLIIPAIMKDTVITGNVIVTVAAFDVSTGAIDFLVEYVPLTTDGALV